MGKGANKDLLANSGTANQRGAQHEKNASGLYDFLTPQLETEATNPTGYAPADLTAMNTASQQSLGGSTAGVVGETNLEAARTNNAGGFQGTAGKATRDAEKTLSQNALQVQSENARLKEAQKQQALASIQQLYGVDTNTALQYLNSSNSALTSENEGSHLANQDFWNSVNNTTKLLGTVAGGGNG